MRCARVANVYAKMGGFVEPDTEEDCAIGAAEQEIRESMDRKSVSLASTGRDA